MYQPARPALDYFKSCLTEDYANFSGRARRAEYWYYSLAIGLAFLALVAVMFVIGAVVASFDPSEDVAAAGMVLAGLMLGAAFLATFIPGLAVTVRRLHDTGRSGWWYLISLIPYVGGIVLFVFTVLDSERGRNQWGPSPKFRVEDDVIDHLEVGRYA